MTWKPFLFCCAVLAGLPLIPAGARAQRYQPTDVDTRPRVVYADSQISVNDRCPVRMSMLALKIPPVYVNDRPVGFCCPSCRPRFVKNPARYLNRLGVELPSAVDTGRAAVLDSGLVRQVNRGFYYFADSAEMLQFDRDPVRYVHSAVDPVTEKSFRPTERSRHIDIDSHRYYFSSDASWIRFDQHRDLYRDRY